MCVGVTLAHVHEIGGEGHSEKVITNNVSATDLSAFFTSRLRKKSESRRFAASGAKALAGFARLTRR